jgi:hypothetical protein
MCESRIQWGFITRKNNKTKLWQENILKINVEHTKSNGEFYFYLYLLDT